MKFLKKLINKIALYPKTSDENIFQWIWANVYKPIKWKYQKIKRGYNDCDLWNLDITFTEFILPRLKAFRNGKIMGHPADFADNGGMEEWLKTIDKMITAFELLKDDMDTFEPDFDFPNLVTKPFFKNNVHVGSELVHENEEAKKSSEAYFQRFSIEYDRREKIISEGLQLFIKFYRNLWD